MFKSNTLNIVNKGNLCYVTFPSLNVSGVSALFTTKHGGKSKDFFATMNMSFTRGDNPQSVLENYKIILEQIGLKPENAVLSHQTHTDNIRVITKQDIGKGIVTQRDFENVDGMITNIPNVALVTMYADCVPLLFFDPVKRVVATSHAGWRGTVKEIGAKTVKKMQAEFGCNPADIRAGIGPSVMQCCYEVDTPVYNEILKLKYININDVTIKKDPSHWMLNLQKLNEQILLNAGLKEKNISVSDICTCCNSDDFYSHRVTGDKRGNLAAVIALKP